MGILWPDAVRNGELLHVDVNESSVPKPLLQFRPRPDFIAGRLKRAVYFAVVPLESGAVETAVFRVGVTIPVLEFNPATGLD